MKLQKLPQVSRKTPKHVSNNSKILENIPENPEITDKIPENSGKLRKYGSTENSSQRSSSFT